jgi:peptidoglycan/xylan/chitin deacetylase (PgdA/CDA1 family)
MATAAAKSSQTAAATGDPTITSWPTGQKLICLTYDDGPDPFTPKLLAYLNENKVPATFYMLGERVKEYPHMVQQIVESGHELGNHTYDHKQLSKMSADKIREELVSTQELLTSASSSAPVPTMRPPYGAQNATVRAICKELGYKVVLWDVDTNDWMGRPAAQMINTILKGTSDGSIILMHDRKHKGVETVLETTKTVVPELRARGFTFVTVSQLLSHPRGGAHAASSPSATTATLQQQAPPTAPPPAAQ